MKNSISITITALSGILTVIALFFAIYNDSYLVLVVVLVTLILSTAVSVLITVLNKEDKEAAYAPNININDFSDPLSDNSWDMPYDSSWDHYGGTEYYSFADSQEVPGIREENDPFAANNGKNPDSHLDNQAVAGGRKDDSTVVIEPEIKTEIINPLPEEEEYGELIAGDSDSLVLSRVHIEIGRDENCDITLKDPTISRRHASLDIEYDLESKTLFLALKDLRSANGTFINGTRIIPNNIQRLQDKDIVKFGNLSLRYHQLDCFESVAKLLYISNLNKKAVIWDNAEW